jgi:hypothetical protein
MKNNRYWLIDKQKYDTVWIKELSLDYYFVNYYDLTDKDIKLIYNLYIDYLINGFGKKAAMKKALSNFDSSELLT